jgi:hypothetical protein
MGQYTRFQTAEAIGDAAKNPGGVAGVGAGLGAGMALGGQMAGAVQSSATAAAPPVPMGGSYFLAVNNVQAGPFDLATLSSKAREGVLTRSSLVWRPGMVNWTPADTVPELQTLFVAAPPPLPSSAGK